MSKSKTPNKSSDVRRQFTPSFKRESAELAQRIGFRQAAHDLEVSENNLRNWVKLIDERGDSAFVSNAERTDTEAELKRLRSENRVLKMERDILKKAATFFAKENA